MSAAELRETRIAPGPRSVLADARELWEARELVYFLFVRELKGQHRQMALGVLWVLIGPIVSMLLYTLIFGVLAGLPSQDLPYPVFNFSALLLWTFFASATESASRSLLQHRELIRKVYFPRLVLPIVGILSRLLDFLAAFLVFLGVLAVYGVTPSPGILLMPLFAALVGLTALAVSTWVAAWFVRYHDSAKLLSYALAGWMYASPVVYPLSVVPEAFRPLYGLNPMTTAIDGFRWAALGCPAPQLAPAAFSLVVVVLLLVGGLIHFRRAEREIVDVA